MNIKAPGETVLFFPLPVGCNAAPGELLQQHHSPGLLPCANK